MKVSKVKISRAGARELMNSAPIQETLLAEAERIRVRAESMGTATYAADVQPGRMRAHAMVKTTDAHSRASNAKHNSLLKAMRG